MTPLGYAHLSSGSRRRYPSQYRTADNNATEQATAYFRSRIQSIPSQHCRAQLSRMNADTLLSNMLVRPTPTPICSI
jgi:hypothetical protein